MKSDYQLVHVGAGHASHILAHGSVLCGADQRRDGSGELPFVNSHRPFRLEGVDCKRCLRKLEAAQNAARRP